MVYEIDCRRKENKNEHLRRQKSNSRNINRKQYNNDGINQLTQSV